MTDDELKLFAYCRTVGATALRKKLRREKRCCSWCGAAVLHPRRLWCSDECVAEYRVRFDPDYAKTQVWRRDHGRCAACGLECSTVMAAVQTIWLACGTTHQRGWQCRCVGCCIKKEYRGHHGSTWEMDHIVAVIDGGGALGITNYRTLCLPCHRRVTKELAKRRAVERLCRNVIQLHQETNHD